MCLAVMPVMAQAQLSTSELTDSYHFRAYTQRVSCHDPSIIIDSITNPKNVQYYIYGSHLGRGKTSAADHYQKWTLFGAGEDATDAANSLFADAQGNLVNYADAYNTHLVTRVKNSKGEEVAFGNFNAHEWQYTGYTVQGNQWAPDVIWNKTMKKWCMYMSLNGDHWASSIVCFVADNVEGPWQYQGPVVFSGFQGTYDHNGYTKTDDWKHTDLSIATGETDLPARYSVGSKWGTYWPNCIDPCVFYDDDDNLWMSYGSWSGGIFMLRLNKENGLRDYTYTFDYEVNGTATPPGAPNANCTSDPYFGKKIAGGYYVSGEASYIEKIGKYYFLFMSYGELQSTGGYQMRIFRSESPTGPFVDPMGTSAIYNKYVLNYHSKNGSAADNRGMLLLGGYRWNTMPSPEIAQGHNSAFTDTEGRSFVVYHTRFNDGNEGHEVRVHQLFLNDEGWLVAAPYEFDGETVTNAQIAQQASISSEEIPGTYQLIIHQYDQNVYSRSYEKPVSITLAADGTVSGSKKGSWTRTPGTDYVTLTLAGVEYRGVLVRQTIDYTDIPAVCIAAVSSSSGSTTIGQSSFTRQQEIWASKANAKAAVAYTFDRQEIPFSDGATIYTHATVQSTSYLGTNVSWKSSDTKILSNGGTVVGEGNAAMTLTVSKDDETFTKVYTLKVDKSATDAVSVYYPESQIKTTDLGFWLNFSKSYYKLNAGGKLRFMFRNHSNMEENYKNWILVACTSSYERANNGYKEYFVLRNDAFGWGTDYQSDGVTHDFDWSTFKQDMNGALVDMTLEYTTDKVLNMTALITTTSGKTYTYSYSCTISTKPGNIKLFLTSEGSYFDSEGIVTGITKVKNQAQKKRGNTYNLGGQRVADTSTGVVVKNGKKIYVTK